MIKVYPPQVSDEPADMETTVDLACPLNLAHCVHSPFLFFLSSSYFIFYVKEMFLVPLTTCDITVSLIKEVVTLKTIKIIQKASCGMKKVCQEFQK